MLAAAVLVAIGCDASVELEPDPSAPATDRQAADETAADKTGEVAAGGQGAADEADDNRPADEPVPLDRPVPSGEPSRGYLGAVAGGYRSAREQIESLAVRQAIQHYQATHGHPPKSHEEFMEKCWKPMQTPLPEIEEGYEYRYDPEAAALFKVPIEAE